MNMLMIVLSVIFWGSIVLLFHTYVIFPLMMGMLGRRRALPQERFKALDEYPEIAVLMAVYNEESVIAATLQSILEAAQPGMKLRCYIGSDGSSDRSNEIIESFAKEDERVHLIPFGGRNGKIRIINELAERAKAELDDPERAIFILCDANVTWCPDLLRRLVSHFKREQVGLVGSAVRDKIREHDGIGDQEEAYIGQENLTKYAEGVLWGRVIGAFGACYAMRARLFTPVPQHHIVDDFYLTFACFEQGYDAIVDLEAIAYEAVSIDIREEFRRKRRIAKGNFQNLQRFWSFLQPWHSDLSTAFAFWSHKGLRWCGPMLIIAGFFACLVLAMNSWLYSVLLSGYLGMGIAVMIDRVFAHRTGRHLKLFRFVRYFLSMNYALLLGFVDFLQGGKNSVWEPTRREASGCEIAPQP